MMRLLREQTGIALPAALGVLVIVGVLSSAVFAVSLRLSDTSTASRDAKRALAAADAGLEAAMFRMNEIGFQDEEMCFTTEGISPASGTDPETGGAPGAGECAGVVDDLGNGSNYTYYVTPGLQDGDTCAGLEVNHTDPNGEVTVTQRCVTAIGEVNGERRRIQARVASYIGTQLFPVGGILAINGITVKNTAIVSGVLGSNGQIDLGNNSYVGGGIELGTSSSPPPKLGSGSTLGGPVTYRSEADGAFVLAPVDMGNTATVNDNGRITSGQDSGSNVTYTDTAASPRDLSIANNGSLTLGGGTYNFCKVTLGNNAYITIAAGAKIRFFLDSPDRSGSGCIPSGMTAAQARAAGYGGMFLGQGSNFNNPGHAINFQIYMYGYTDGTHKVEFNNTSAMNAAIYAPASELVWVNTAGISGGVAASKVEFKNSATFSWAGASAGFSLSDLRTDTVSVYYRMAWAECRQRRTASSDPESGC
jgi:type II secretory pathway pseudopilin PulG